jgi:amidase
MPASFCGVVGYKPTYGLVPYTGAFPIEQSIDEIGPITRTVRDAALMLSVVAGFDGCDPRQPRGVAASDYLGAIEAACTGLRVGVVKEGFSHDNSEPQVDATVRDAINILCSAGLEADEVSIPWHRHGARIWDVIATEGGAWQMIDGNGYGMNWKGLYDPELMDFYGAKWRQDPTAFSETVKLVLLASHFVRTRYHGKHYGMARNLEAPLAGAYDKALEAYDVLIMPTMPIRASVIPAQDASVEEVITKALEMIPNTTPFSVTGHPACSVPAGLAGGLPVGMQIVGKQFDDSMVLRVANSFEQAVGGFPAPPSA